MRGLVCAALAGGLGPVLAGCAADGETAGLQALVDVLGAAIQSPAVRLVGGDAERYCYLQTSPANAALDAPVRGTVYVVDLGTGGVEQVASDIELLNPLFGDDVACDGQYAVWPDRAGTGVVVLDLATGETQKLAEAYDFRQSPPAEPRVRDGHAALLHVASNDDAIATSIVWIDIASGEVQAVATDWPYPAFDVAGERLAYHTQPSGTVNIRSLELGADLYVMDFTTGARFTVATNRRVTGDGGTVFLHEGEVLWHEFVGGSFTEHVRAYDLTTQQTRPLFNDVVASAGAGTNRHVRLADVSAAGVLLDAETGAVLRGGVSGRLTYAAFDGARNRIMDYRYTVLTPGSAFHDAQLNGAWVVRLDVANRRIVARNLTSGAQRTLEVDL